MSSHRIYNTDLLNSKAISVDRLIKEGYLPPGKYVCPSSGLHTSNYIIVHYSANQAGIADSAVIAYEPKSNHNGVGGNIIFGDGHMNFEKGVSYDNLIRTIPVSSEQILVK